MRTIAAALMLVDLRDFTLMSDTLAPAAVIETLNRYFDCVMLPINQHGGEVWKSWATACMRSSTAILRENPVLPADKPLRRPRKGSKRSHDRIDLSLRIGSRAVNSAGSAFELWPPTSPCWHHWRHHPHWPRAQREFRACFIQRAPVTVCRCSAK